MRIRVTWVQSDLFQLAKVVREKHKVSYTVGFTQHHGKNKQFPKQQDCLWNGQEIFQKNDVPPSGYVTRRPLLSVAVADGVGMSPFSEKASRAVLTSLVTELGKGADFDRHVLRRVHGHLCDVLAKGKTFGSATTLAAVQCLAKCCTVLNVGDSRVYQISESSQWIQLSHDHTLINSMIARGEAESGKEYASFYYSLDSCLVADDEETEFQFHKRDTLFLPGESLLVCTDGVHDTLGDARLQNLYAVTHSPQAQVEVWRNAILSAGAPDNFSMILVHYDMPNHDQ
ncbi:PP2C family protein-serine/threonine phosphatase [Ferrovum myxofaciens]|nr:protein phosphatase 2C domain-containing protein [Ferrovum myxofaciens]